MNHSLFIHSSAEGPLGCFQFWWFHIAVIKHSCIGFCVDITFQINSFSLETQRNVNVLNLWWGRRNHFPVVYCSISFHPTLKIAMLLTFFLFYSPPPLILTISSCTKAFSIWLGLGSFQLHLFEYEYLYYDWHNDGHSGPFLATS